jgi:hypothetical protein
MESVDLPADGASLAEATLEPLSEARRVEDVLTAQLSYASHAHFLVANRTDLICVVGPRVLLPLYIILNVFYLFVDVSEVKQQLQLLQLVSPTFLHLYVAIDH